jgi:hypothetical protein
MLGTFGEPASVNLLVEMTAAECEAIDDGPAAVAGVDLDTYPGRLVLRTVGG